VLLGGVFSRVAWSPDSSAIAVRGVSWEGGPAKPIQGIQANEQVHLVDRVTGSARLLTAQAGPGNCGPAWSPDGNTVAVITPAAGAEQLVAFPSGGGPSVILTQAAALEFPVWSP